VEQAWAVVADESRQPVVGVGDGGVGVGVGATLPPCPKWSGTTFEGVGSVPGVVGAVVGAAVAVAVGVDWLATGCAGGGGGG
jgi:hypothetical protein